MRQVNRLLRHARVARRQPPRPRWIAPLRRLAIPALAVAALSGTTYLTVETGLTAAAYERMRQQLRLAEDRLGLRVRDILTQGRQRTTRRELAAALASYEGQYILAVDLQAVRERLERLPWVRRATVKRLLPSTLLVRLEEHRPAALWRGPEGLRLIGTEGEAIPIEDLRAFRDLPLLHGAGAPARLPALHRLLRSEPELARRVTGAAWIGDRRWDLFVDGRTTVRLPEREAEKAWRLLAREERRSRLLERAIDAVDLRNPDWIVLRLNRRILRQPGRKAA